MISALVGKLVFKAQGWTYSVNEDAISDPKQVVIGFPHTTNNDAVRAMAIFNIAKLNYHILIKKELFKFPTGSVLKALGGIPVDRENSKNIVQFMTDQFASAPRYTLAIAPEATRSKDGTTRPIRTGFWHIAHGAGVPITLMYSDIAKKHGEIFAKIYTTDSMEHDLLEIQRLYAEHNIPVLLPEKMR